jgi:hypothetical protein
MRKKRDQEKKREEKMDAKERSKERKKTVEENRGRVDKKAAAMNMLKARREERRERGTCVYIECYWVIHHREMEAVIRLARIGSEHPLIRPEPGHDILVGVCQEDHQRPKEYWESTVRHKRAKGYLQRHSAKWLWNILIV